MDISPKLTLPSAQKITPTPFPPYQQPLVPVLPSDFSWDNAPYYPETFLDSFELDYSDKPLELRNRIVKNLRGPLTF
jgi:hypothetical protein